MNRVTTRSRRVVILLGILLVSFALYAAADGGGTVAPGVLLGLLVLFVLLAVIVG